MTTLLTDVYEALSNDAGIAAIVSDRVYARKPIQTPDGAYITISRQDLSPQVADIKQRLRIFIFSQDLAELEQLSNLVREYLVDRTVLNGNGYYKISMLGQTDSPDALNTGFYWNVQQYEFAEC